jgi:hypothetical protein
MEEWNMKRKFLILLAVAAMACWFPGQAMANSVADFTSFIGTPNTALSPYTGPYVKVEIDLTSATTADVKFTSLTNSGNIYLMGDGSAAALNVNATTFTVGSLAGSNSGTGFTPGSFTVAKPPGTSNVDELGLFNCVIDDSNGFTHAADQLTFTLTRTDAGSWGNAAEVLFFNTAGYDAAAHVFVTSYPANADNAALVTGFAGEVPLPGAVWLLGSGLLSLGGWRRFKKG